MAKIEDLQALDLDQVNPDLLKQQILQLLSDYEEEEDKKLFQKEAGANITRLYDLVKKYSPDAIISEYGKMHVTKEVNEKKTRKKRIKKEEKESSEKEEKEKKEKEKAEKESLEKEKAARERKATSKKAMEEIKEIGKEIEACRQVIRAYNQKKKEASGKEPVKKTRLTKLKDKLLGIAVLIPDDMKEDKSTRDKTEKILLGTLSELKKAWGLNLIKPAQEAIKEKFDQMEEKQQKKEEKETA